MRSILILEDNKDINKALSNILKRTGYNVYSTYNAFEALKVFSTNTIDCIITDLMLPIMSGEEFIQEVRKKSTVHIIVISAKTTNSDKLQGLKNGADDYLFKPFIEEEILIKLENYFAKKQALDNHKSFNNKEVIFTEGSTTLLINDKEINLTSVEYHMVKLLIQEAHKVISRNQFLDVLYTYDNEVFDRVIDVHIRNIRKKLSAVYDKELIKTVYGLGYSWIGYSDE